MTTVLLDTQTFIDHLSHRERLNAECLAMLDSVKQDGQLAISVATVLQLREMRAIGTLSEQAFQQLREPLLALDSPVAVKPIDVNVVRDIDLFPSELALADRIVAATAKANNMLLITANVALLSLSVESLWSQAHPFEVRIARASKA